MSNIHGFPGGQMVENAAKDAAVVLNQVRAGKGPYGYNAATRSFGDMLDAGILDPTKETRLALQNSASNAGPLLTTEMMIAEVPKDDEHANGGGGMPGGVGGWTYRTAQASCRSDEDEHPAGNCRGFFASSSSVALNAMNEPINPVQLQGLFDASNSVFATVDCQSQIAYKSRDALLQGARCLTRECLS